MNKEMEPQIVENKKLLNKLMEEMKERVRSQIASSADKALYHAFVLWWEDLPFYYLKADFHKAFRSIDIVPDTCGHADMIMYHLLEESEMFWELYTKHILKDQEE